MLLFALIVAASKVCIADEITLVADVWCPYNCKADDTQKGILLEIAKRAFSKQGLHVSYQVVPWARAIEETRTGKYDAIMGAYKSDAPDFIFPEQALAVSHDVFFVSKDSKWKYVNLASLSHVSLGVIRDYAYGEPLDSYIAKHFEDPTRIQVSSGDDALKASVKKLLSGRLQVVVEDRAVMSYYIQQNKLQGQIIEAGEVGSDNVFIAFSPAKPNSKKWARLISDTMLELKSSGAYDQLMSKYGLNDLQTEKQPAAPE